jgi:hypothetical protein
MSPIVVALVAVATFVVAAVALRLVPTPRICDRAWLAPALLGAGVLSLFLTQEAWPSWQHRQMWHSIVRLAIVLGAMGLLLDPLLRDAGDRFSARPLLRAVLCGATTLLFLRLPASDRGLPAHAAAAGAVALAWLAAPLGARARGFAFPAACAFAALALVALLMHGGFAKGALTTLGIAAALGAVAVASLGANGRGLGPFGAAVAMTLLAAFAAVGRAYQPESHPIVPHAAWIVPPLAPLAAWAGALPWIKESPWQRAIAHIAGPLAVLAIGLGLAFGTADAPPADDDPYAAFR